ncbi:MAG: glycosyltransferase 87 family protein [Pseudomonadota bacterium]
MAAFSPILKTGLCIAVLLIGLSGLSAWFPYGAEITDMPVLAYIGVALLIGAVWFVLPLQIKSKRSQSVSLVAILAIGLIARGAMFFSSPVLEDDSYRYLWDGAVTARGIDPYQYAPSEAGEALVLASDRQDELAPDLATLKTLATDHPEIHSRINYPYVSTIYPPLTQAAFALAHIIDPFGLTGWRLVLLMADLISFVLLIGLLRAYQRDPAWATLYWWNPVVILQGFGAGHMDILVLPFLLGTVLPARQQRPAWASLALAGAAGIKLWPILLFPLIARPYLSHPRRLIWISAIVIGATGLLLAPQLLHAINPDAGLNAYASDWRTHAFLFALFEDFVFAFTNDPGQVARLFVAAMVIALTAFLSLRFADTTDRLPALMVAIIASLILLSPTGYPWYFIWLAPFLTFIPAAGLRGLILLAPLYWLRFQLGDDNPVYQWIIVPLAFGIPLALLANTLRKQETRDEIGHHYSSAE